MNPLRRVYLSKSILQLKNYNYLLLPKILDNHYLYFVQCFLLKHDLQYNMINLVQ